MIRNVFILIAVFAMTTESSSLTIPRSRRNVDTCGAPNIKTGLIVRGQTFTRGSLPWIVALMHTGWTPPKFFCGATIISKTFVISAAHCILPKHTRDKFLARDILAIFGAHDLSDAYESGRYQLSPKKIYVHDDWNPRTVEYDADVSLLEFDERFIHFNDFVQPICLWDSENKPPVTEGIVSGWGKSEDATKPHENLPKLVKAVIQSNEDCFLDAKALVDLSSRRTFCAGLRNGSGVCQGDSGGGLFIEVNDVFHLKGIVSSSLLKGEDCDVSTNAVYTNVLKFKEWIRDIAGDIQSANEFESNLEPSKKIFCKFVMDEYGHESVQLNTCTVDLDNEIDSEDFVLGSPTNTSIEMFRAFYSNKMKFVPRNIGDKFPNLKIFRFEGCELTIVRNFYFKNMRRLEILNLYDNQIATIEANSFDELFNLVRLYLDNNQIETLDEKLFVKMARLQVINLNKNQIKFLSPATFKIPGGRFRRVDLYANVCVSEDYDDEKNNLNQLEADLRANCSGSPN